MEGSDEWGVEGQITEGSDEWKVQMSGEWRGR